MKVSEVKKKLREMNVLGRVKRLRGTDYIDLHVKPEDADKVKKSLGAYSIGIGFCYNTRTITLRMG